MELTPIKIRGKGPRKKGFKPPQPRRQRSPSGMLTRSSKRRKTRPAALIEQLPLEILERIFLFSGNLSLPRSSLRIGYNLSGRSFRLELLVSAFAPTWDVWFGCTHGQEGQVHSYYGYYTDTHRIGGDPDFQSDVLSCPWATVDMILDAMDIWLHRHGRGRYYEHVRFLCSPWPTEPPGSPRSCGPPHEFHSGGFDHVTSIHDCFESDWRGFAADPFCHPTTFASTHRGVHPSTRVPEGLVAGPFDWEKVRRLFWLRCNGAALAPVPGENWELTKQGFDNIMRLDDDKLAFLLVRLYHSWDVFDSDWPEHVRHEVRDDLEAWRLNPNIQLRGTCRFTYQLFLH